MAYQIIGSQTIKDSQVPTERLVYIVCFGKHADDKPDETEYKIATGSSATEIDTGNTYYFDAENHSWGVPGGGT